MKAQTPCANHTLLEVKADRLSCLRCPWHLHFRDLKRWVYTVGRMMLAANMGVPRRTEQRDALIQAYESWAKKHGKSKHVDSVTQALLKTT